MLRTRSIFRFGHQELVSIVHRSPLLRYHLQNGCILEGQICSISQNTDLLTRKSFAKNQTPFEPFPLFRPHHHFTNIFLGPDAMVPNLLLFPLAVELLALLA